MSIIMQREIVVIGAGVAGLAAARRLSEAGHQPLIVEARERIGGRIYTDHRSTPVELGAEFIHGAQACTWSVVRTSGLATVPWSGQRAIGVDGRLLPKAEGQVLLAQMTELFDRVTLYEGLDVSADEVLRSISGADELALQYARRWIAGIEAADVTRLSARWVSWERAQSTAGTGWDNFRLAAGYDGVPLALASGLEVQLGTAVHEISWDEGNATLHLEGGKQIRARRVVVTVPLSLLQSGALAFTPALPAEKQAAIASIVMGNVTKLVLWFKRPFWPSFAFLNTDGMAGTWWPSVGGAALVGYIGGPDALQLAALGEEGAVAQGLDEVALLLGHEARQLFVSGRLAAWSNDPWSGGAYSYTPVGGGGQRAQIAKPVANTLFFAGEATETGGHLATVHGAIETGWRAAEEILTRNT